ncbi:hypothetical protein EII14_07005 [Alloprevotella sp. OH1205_COT-284]|uniref:hypothetical protein n=1 Tax=Alloprevotella sp. OH1205_COT-284 TaxID=2491043 RepID=UPI000F5D5B86|nr:hypothetical protein [Alloprevotella sp. OH1205_COT-284]RRD78234.1 hypothetical protein EII14_07005 [Alloprevotella sp. OH1205_COT-284]
MPHRGVAFFVSVSFLFSPPDGRLRSLLLPPATPLRSPFARELRRRCPTHKSGVPKKKAEGRAGGKRAAGGKKQSLIFRECLEIAYFFVHLQR